MLDVGREKETQREKYKTKHEYTNVYFGCCKLTSKLVQNISGIHHTDGSTRPCKPEDQCCFSVYIRTD